MARLSVLSDTKESGLLSEKLATECDCLLVLDLRNPTTREYWCT